MAATTLQPIERTASLTRNALELAGKNLAKLTKNNTLTKKTLAALDLSDLQKNADRQKNAFHDQIPNLTGKLLAKSPAARYAGLAGKVMPNKYQDKLSNEIFYQIGKLAQAWANSNLEHDDRFHAKLDDSQRHALATAIADQNRTLATAAGLTNAMGLPAILIDTLWLLVVSLRSIFQIAQIYDKPLTGKQGIAIAYEVLAKTDLKKLQEKQTLLAAIGVIDAVADDNLSPNPTELEHTGANPMLVIFKGLEEISNTIHSVTGFNATIIHKLLPITAIGVGITYNNEIINEVVQVAQAAFAPSPKLATLNPTLDPADPQPADLEPADKDRQDSTTTIYQATTAPASPKADNSQTSKQP